MDLFSKKPQPRKQIIVLKYFLCFISKYKYVTHNNLSNKVFSTKNINSTLVAIKANSSQDIFY